MDPHAFDGATRLSRTVGSRRSAWRALLGAAVLGTITLPAAAAPCANGKHLCGGRAGQCCPGKCFRSVRVDHELCCSGSDPITGSGLVICGNRCCQDVGEDPCECCLDPGAEIAAAAPTDHCQEGISGSYRRR